VKRNKRILTRLYALLLNLYPRAYRVEYDEELQTVFNLAVNEAAQQGGFSVIWMSIRELRDLPGGIIFEHWRERRKRRMTTERGSLLTFEPGSWRETLAAMAPFLLLGLLPPLLHLMSLPPLIPAWLRIGLTLGLVGLLGSLFITGMLKGVQRWVLPYVGVFLSLFSVYAFSELLFGLFAVLVGRRDPWFLRQVVYQGKLWIGLFVATLFIVLVAWVSPRWRPFYWRIRRDWTLLSFVLYGASLFALLLTFDDYPYDEPYIMAGMVILAMGGWFYLRSRWLWQRALALFTGLTLAMAVAAAGKAVIYSIPGWSSGMFTWQTEAMSTAIMWGWLVMMVFAPILMNLLPRPAEHLPTE